MATDGPDGAVPAPAERGQLVLDLLDKAIHLQSPLVRKNIVRARQRNPEATPSQVIRNLERIYVSALAGTGAGMLKKTRSSSATAPLSCKRRSRTRRSRSSMSAPLAKEPT